MTASGAQTVSTRASRAEGTPDRPALITGGAGFIGTNLAERLLGRGKRVIILDNLSRDGVERNLRCLRDAYGDLVEVQIGDVRDRRTVEKAVGRCDRIYHLAAQVAVTTSLLDPVADFETNLLGTLNVLEAARRQPLPVPLLFTSTNKVYGDLRDVGLARVEDRYVPSDRDTQAFGINESRHLDFHSPYGCSKGAADQYVIDYARIYGMANVVFRMSCIYGRHQLGTEDQGWVAHFTLQMQRGGHLNVYGDGLQVRDILYVDDLVNAIQLAMEDIEGLAGRAFNIGGGPDNAVSLHEVIGRLARLSGVEPQIRYLPARKGDQPYYVSDTRRFTDATGWAAQMSVDTGIEHLHNWVVENMHSVSGVLQSKE